MSDKLKILETFKNEYPNRDYTIEHTSEEFTSLCPVTGQPDFATIILEYIPGQLCIELKSLKLYYQSYRNEGVFYETLTNKILEDLVEVCKPRYMNLRMEFKTRGGISSEIEAEYEIDDFSVYDDDDDEFPTLN